MSGEPNRDRTVEDALRRSRAGQSSATARARTDACLDTETFALWVDDGLSAADRAAAERHVAECARCQATLAALVRTIPTPERRRPWWQTMRVAWLAPVAATATALAIWVAVPSAPPPHSPVPSVPASAPVVPSSEPAKQEAETAPAVAVKPLAVERRDEKALVEKPLAAPEQAQETETRASDIAAAASPQEAPPPPAVAPPPTPAAPTARASSALRAFSGAA
ncbi:MAG TPA: zf-HC2 domain-containing protein, partial [Vicinamibacterales bacterium]|nr:zf-HC2 domain-containing protein [Vicinamibacterales bacterium]